MNKLGDWVSYEDYAEEVAILKKMLIDKETRISKFEETVLKLAHTLYQQSPQYINFTLKVDKELVKDLDV